MAETIHPMVEAYPDVEFIGEIDEHDKADFLGGATALLFPIDWPEPFGLVMIEAMACGNPVIAYRRGSVPEIIEENVSGFLVDTIDEAVMAVRRVASLNRATVRDQFERRFTVERMAGDYVDIYRRLPPCAGLLPSSARRIEGKRDFRRSGRHASPLKGMRLTCRFAIRANCTRQRSCPQAARLLSDGFFIRGRVVTEANTKMPEKIETAAPSTPCVQRALTRNRCSICLSDLGGKALFATLPKCRHPSRGLCFVGSC